MSSAFSIRADAEFLNRVRKAAKEAGVSLTTYVTSAVEMRLAAVETEMLLDDPVRAEGLVFTPPSLLDAPMTPAGVPREALRGGRVTPKAPLPEPHEAAPAPPEIAQLRSKLSRLTPVTPKRHHAGCTCLVCASA